MGAKDDKLAKMLQPKLAASRLRPDGLVHVHMLVSDMKRSIDFYVRVLGFFYDHGIHEAAWLRLRNLLLTLSPGEVKDSSSSYFGWTVGSFAELEATYERLYRAGQRLGSPPDASAARAYFFLYDPDDYPIVFSHQEFEYPAIFDELPGLEVAEAEDIESRPEDQLSDESNNAP